MNWLRTLLVVGLFPVLLLNAAIAQDPQQQLRAINNQARTATDEASVRSLASLIRQQFAWISSADWSKVEDRLVGAELRYRDGSGHGVSEGHVTGAINQLAARLHLPEYAHTSRKQVRYIRVATNAYTPALVYLPKETGVELSPDDGNLSPLGALYVALVLMDQKLNNPDFQLTPREWDDHEYRKRMEAWEARKQGKTTATQKGLRIEPVQPRAQQLRQQLRDSLSTMPSGDRELLVPAFVSDLGLN